MRTCATHRATPSVRYRTELSRKRPHTAIADGDALLLSLRLDHPIESDALASAGVRCSSSAATSGSEVVHACGYLCSALITPLVVLAAPHQTKSLILCRSLRDYSARWRASPLRGRLRKASGVQIALAGDLSNSWAGWRPPSSQLAGTVRMKTPVMHRHFHSNWRSLRDYSARTRLAPAGPPTQSLRRSNRPGGRFVELVGGLAPAELSSCRHGSNENTELALPTRFELVYLP